MIGEFSWSSFIEVPGFLARWDDIRCTDRDLRGLQLMLLSAPTRWPVVPGAGGWRKARFAPQSWPQGKSGAVRVYYAELRVVGMILLGAAFTKSEMSDLEKKDKRELGALLAVYRKRFEEF